MEDRGKLPPLLQFLADTKHLVKTLGAQTPGVFRSYCFMDPAATKFNEKIARPEATVSQTQRDGAPRARDALHNTICRAELARCNTAHPARCW